MLNRIISSGSRAKVFATLIEELSKFCRRYKGRFLNSQLISLSFSQLDLIKFKSKPYQLLIQLNQRDNSKILVNTPLKVDSQSSAKACSQSGSIEARFIKGESDTFHLQIWDQFSLLRRKKLDKHIKDVYNDEFYGKIQFSPSQNLIIFIAENAEPKFKTFWSEEEQEDQKKQAKNQEGQEEKKKDDKQKKPKMKEANEKFNFIQSFGETKSHIKRPIIGVYNIQQDKLTFLKNLDSQITPQYPIFHPTNQKSILFSGQHTPHFKHGMTFCLNRSTSIYMIEDFETYAKDENLTQPTNITKSSYLSICPKFTPDGKWMTYAGRTSEFLTHLTCFQLFKRPVNQINDESSTKITVPLIHKRDKEGKFNGLFGYQSNLSNRYLLSSNSHELFSSQFEDKQTIYILNIDTNQITRIPSGPQNNFGQINILDVKDDKVLISASSNFILPEVWLLSNLFNKQNPKQLNNAGNFQWTKITECRNIVESKFKSQSAQLLAQVSEFLKNSVQAHTITYKESQATLLLPKQKSNEKVPMLVTIHGGPHTHVSNMFLISRLTLLLNGYAVLLPNYRGSTGFGLDFLEQLLGNVGSYDVEDCGQLTKAVISQFGEKYIDSQNVVVFGGSHGGFLTGWLVGHPEYSKFFKGGILWNPVINMSAMVGCSDIPEWIFAECLNQKQNWAPSIEQNSQFYKKSPISVVGNVKCPILMLIGAKDMRVPPASGFQFYNTLRAMKVDVEMKWYPQDGHAIAGEETSLNALMSMWIWLENLIKGKNEKDQ